MPRSVTKDIRDVIMNVDEEAKEQEYAPETELTLEERIAQCQQLMEEAAKNLEFELAAKYRDEIVRLKGEQNNDA